MEKWQVRCCLLQVRISLRACFMVAMVWLYQIQLNNIREWSQADYKQCVIMTQIFVLLPLCQLDKQTNNSEVVRSVLSEKYPWIDIEQVLWMEAPKEGQKEGTNFQCTIRTPQVDIGLEQIVETIEAHRMQVEVISRLKKDLSSLIQSYSALKNKPETPTRNKQQGNQEDADVSLGLKMERESSRSTDRRLYSEGELLKSISDLTRENIKLKDTIGYYQAQVEFMSREGGEALSVEAK